MYMYFNLFFFFFFFFECGAILYTMDDVMMVMMSLLSASVCIIVSFPPSGLCYIYVQSPTHQLLSCT